MPETLTRERWPASPGYQAIEAGRKSDIRFSTLEKLAKACELELWVLLNLDEEPLAVGEDPSGVAKASPGRRRRKG